MKIENRTGHSVNISDIERNFAPKEEVSFYEISKQELLKSMSLRNLIRSSRFYPIEIDNESSLEVNLKKESDIVLSMSSSEKEQKNSGVILRGQFLDYSGYAKVNRNLAAVIKKNNIPISINAVDSAHPRLIGSDLVLSSSFTYTNSSFGDVVIDSVVPSFDSGRGRKKSILYTTVEAYTVPDSFSKIFDQYDEIWTTSNFCKTVISGKTNKPVHVVPGIVDFENYTASGEKFDLHGKAKSFKFISVFNWNHRKGADALIRAYCQAFSGTDDVSLILVCRKRRVSGPARGVKDEVEKEIANVKMANPPHIVRLTKEINEIQLASLYRSCDAFVLPTRGEGYGLPYLEAGLCGIPVIGTKVSAVQDILSEDTSLLIDIDGFRKVPENATGCYFWDGQMMADLTSKDFINRLAEGMRDMVNNYHKYAEKNKAFQNFIYTKCSSHAVFNTVKDLLP